MQCTQRPYNFWQTTVDLEALEAWADKPDVCEGDVGELTAPFHGDADTTAEGHDGVAKLLPALETFVGVFPDTFHRPDVFWLTEDVLKANLQVRVDVVRITVHHVEFGGHGCCFFE